MTVITNTFYTGPDMPGSTVCPPNLNPHINVRRLPAMADVSDLLTAGVLCYLTATTNASDMTPASAVYGNDSREGIICVVEIQTWNPYFAATTTRAIYPNKVPNSSVTLTDYTHTQNTHITVIPLVKDMWVWLIGSVDITFDTVLGYEYVSAANGLITGVGDPDGVAIDEACHLFTAMATITNKNWHLFRYDGKVAHDKTA